MQPSRHPIHRRLDNQASLQQSVRKLSHTVDRLSGTMYELESTMREIKEHEFVRFHRSKWKIVAYNIAMGMLFAVGTVMGLAMLSWASYTILKDSQIVGETIRSIVESQLKARNFDFKRMQEQLKNELQSTTGAESISSTGSTVVE